MCRDQSPAAVMAEQGRRYRWLLKICVLQAPLLLAAFLPAALPLPPVGGQLPPLSVATRELLSFAALAMPTMLANTCFNAWWARRLFWAAAGLRRARNAARRGTATSKAEQPARP